MSEEQQEKGFTITDKRSVNWTTEEKTLEGEVREGKTSEDPMAKSESFRERLLGRIRKEEGEKDTVSPPSEEEAIPEIDFSSFILSLSSSVFIHLGEAPDPVSNEKQKNLSMAKQTIDILDMLQKKTRGNLSPEEENLTGSILYDLRMRYLQYIR